VFRMHGITVEAMRACLANPNAKPHHPPFSTPTHTPTTPTPTTGLLPPTALKVLLTAAAASTGVFAGRKYTQAVKDDIGDKSVFE